jgi:effector-binding domain-containing protein
MVGLEDSAPPYEIQRQRKRSKTGYHSTPVILMENVRLEQFGGLAVAVVERRAKVSELSRVVPAACGVVWGVVRGLKLTGLGRNVAFYLDDDLEINLEVGVEVETPFAGSGEVIGSALPAGPVATVTHFGPYNGLAGAHQAIRQWCSSHGHKLAGPNWEIYGHWIDEWNHDPAKIRTDVYYLLDPDIA